jgi:integrase
VAEGVYQKPSGRKRYLAQFRDPGGKQRWKAFERVTDAKRWRADGMRDPRTTLEGRRRLREVFETFMRHHAGGLSASTQASWHQQWRRHIEPEFGDWRIGKITTKSVKDWLADMEEEGIGPPTRAKCRAILHRLMEEAMENGEVGSNPVAPRGTRVKQAQPKKARVLTTEELGRVIGAAERVASHSDRLAIESLFMFGLRLGEMAGLQARDLDVETRTITIARTVVEVRGELTVQEHTKTRESRAFRVPLELDLWQGLVEHVHREGLIGQAPLFPAPRGGHIRPNAWRRRVWRVVMESSGIADPPSPHSGRRTTASLLVERGATPATVQAILGHSSLAQTGAYVDVAVAQTETALSLLTTSPLPLPVPLS